VTTDTARALLYRHGLPEDIIDGALCLHAQELAAVQRRDAAVWGVDTAAGKHILAAADLIDPAKGAAAPAGPVPATDRSAVLLWAADRYETILASQAAEHSSDPRYYTGVRDVILGLRRLAGDADPAAVLPAPTDRAVVRAEALREAAAAIEQEQAREEATEWAQYGELDHETEIAGGAVRASAALLRRMAGEAQQDEEPERGCAHCGGDHDWDDCEEYTALVAREAQQDPTQDGEALCVCGHGTDAHDATYSDPQCAVCPEDGERSWRHPFTPTAPARSGQPDTDEDDELLHVGWWCWRGDNHGHLATTPCRSDNVPIHVPAEWADDMRAVLQRIEDGDEPDTDPEADPS
jgi:hypothetical protein